MAEEKIYTIPIRNTAKVKARGKRTRHAVSVVRKYLEKYAKAKTIKIGSKLNEEIWSRGNKKPPASVRVKAVIDAGVLKVELFGHDYKDFKALSVAKKEKLTDKLRARLSAKEQQAQDLEDKVEGKKEEKAGEETKPTTTAPVAAPAPAPKPEAKPTETKPESPKPAEAKPEPKPAEAEPEKKPAEPEPSTEEKK